MAEKEIRLCKNIAKFSQNLPFQLAKFCSSSYSYDRVMMMSTFGEGGGGGGMGLMMRG